MRFGNDSFWFTGKVEIGASWGSGRGLVVIAFRLETSTALSALFQMTHIPRVAYFQGCLLDVLAHGSEPSTRRLYVSSSYTIDPGPEI